ncbi:hypothetical protein TcasGA2_TC034220 [Tribolium castaneum]|uniref:Uncharacterized protein n=1 Tax=Tribolium castaneum TaxID=7070 RepID=A0A139WPE1_TRICA|nr:hypothetical protein TcasGA2_TC034220 [Tribolium castaneum]
MTGHKNKNNKTKTTRKQNERTNRGLDYDASSFKLVSYSNNQLLLITIIK